MKFQKVVLSIVNQGPDIKNYHSSMVKSGTTRQIRRRDIDTILVACVAKFSENYGSFEYQGPGA